MQCASHGTGVDVATLHSATHSGTNYAFGLATLTLSLLSCKSYSLNMVMALSASAAVGMETNAKPFERPVPLSMTSSTDETLPAVANKVLISSCVVSLLRLPT